MDANITGQSAMLAYNMLLCVIPIALLGLFLAGQVLTSSAVQRSVLTDLREVFPGAAEHTLNSLLNQITSSTTTTGVLALMASLWLGSSFWGALDTAFSHIYGCPARRWVDQKRFGFAMVWSCSCSWSPRSRCRPCRASSRRAPSGCPSTSPRSTGLVYGISLGDQLALLFGCLALIYAQVPNRHGAWRAVWPGALGATLAIGVVTTRSRVSVEHLDDRPLRHHDRLRADRAGWFYMLARDHPRRCGRQRAAARRGRARAC